MASAFDRACVRNAAAGCPEPAAGLRWWESGDVDAVVAAMPRLATWWRRPYETPARGDISPMAYAVRASSWAQHVADSLSATRHETVRPQDAQEHAMWWPDHRDAWAAGDLFAVGDLRRRYVQVVSVTYVRAASHEDALAAMREDSDAGAALCDGYRAHRVLHTGDAAEEVARWERWGRTDAAGWSALRRVWTLATERTAAGSVAAVIEVEDVLAAIAAGIVTMAEARAVAEEGAAAFRRLVEESRGAVSRP